MQGRPGRVRRKSVRTVDAAVTLAVAVTQGRPQRQTPRVDRMLKVEHRRRRRRLSFVSSAPIELLSPSLFAVCPAWGEEVTEVFLVLLFGGKYI